jgi:hypothetical protein
MPTPETLLSGESVNGLPPGAYGETSNQRRGVEPRRCGQASPIPGLALPSKPLRFCCQVNLPQCLERFRSHLVQQPVR